jgi:Tfp pilus assembly protein PilF
MQAEAAVRPAEGVAHEVLRRQAALLEADLIHRRWEIADRRAAFVLKLLSGLAGLVIAGVLAAMVVSAIRADGLVIAPFSVPPALAQRGVTGEALASQLLDRLDGIAAGANTSTKRKAIFADRHEDIAIEIPNTGVTLGQAEQWLRAKLGRQTRVTAELMQEPDGRLTLTARIGAKALAPQTGGPGEIAALLQGAAEALYGHEQGSDYALYLIREGRLQDAAAFDETELVHPDLRRQARGYLNLGNVLQRTEGDAAAAEAFRAALAMGPRFTPAAAANNLAFLELYAGHAESSLRLSRLARTLNAADRSRTAEGAAQLQGFLELQIAGRTGDHLTALTRYEAFQRSSKTDFVDTGRRAAGVRKLSPLHRLNLHEIAPEAALAEFRAVAADPGRQGVVVDEAAAGGFWAILLSEADRMAAQMQARPDHGVLRQTWRWHRARALAELGRGPEAAEAIAATPLDCQPCVLTRAIVAERAGDRAHADHWFAEAAKLAPSLPQARFEWGKALLARGATDAAIVQLREAQRVGPRWADPPALWGEALMRQGDAVGAAAKFASAARLSPRWGGLRLNWGEALARSGKADKARAQWRIAGALALSAAERATLARLAR